MSTGLMHAFDDPPSSVNLQALDFSVNSEKIVKLNIQSPVESLRNSKQVSSRPNPKKSYFLYGNHSSGHEFDRSRQIIRPESQQLIQPTLIPMDSQYQRPYQKGTALEILSPLFNSQTNYETLAPLSSQGGKTKANQIMIGYLTRRFITKISTSRRRKLFFRSNHFQILGDYATNDELNQLTVHRQQYKLCCNKSIMQRGERYKNKINSLIQKALKHIPLIYPQSPIKIIWDLFLCTVLIYFFILIPIQICFQNNILFLYPLTTLFFMVFLLLDQLVKIDTVYYEYGKPVTSRYSIFQRYLKNIFLSDSLSIGSIFLSYLNYSSSKPNIIFDIPLLVIYTQFNNFSSIFRFIEESLNLSKLMYSIWSLIKLIMTLLFSEHLFSCFWYFIAAYKEKSGEINWMSELGINDESWEIKYLDSFYFSTVTMLSVGYGDITPTSKFISNLDPLEKVVSIIFMLYACIQLSYSVNTVGTIIQTLQEQRDYFKSKIRLINSYMNKNKVSFNLQYQVREYLRIYLKQQLEKETQEEEQIIESLSDSLRNRLIFEANNSTLLTCPLFNDHLSTETKYKLLKQMKQIVINPETIVTSWLIDFNEPCLCFIKEGQLNFFLNSRLNPNLGTFKEGEYFGLESFITGQTPHQQYSSQSFVKLIIITRSDFLRTIQESPSDYEEFCMIRDKILLKITEEDKIVCQSCNCKGHDLNHCPIVHYKVDREKVIKSHQYCETQHRQPIERHQKKNHFSALQDQWAISELASMIQENEDDRCVFYSKVNQMFHNENSQTVNLDHNSSRARKNFQRIVNLVSRLSYLIKPSKRRLLRKQCIQKLFDINSHNNIQQLSKLLIDANCKDYLAKQEIENLYFLKLRIDSNKIESEYDNQKSYRQYFPENNLEQILSKDASHIEFIRQDEIIIPSVQGRSQNRLRNLRISLLQYMLYPHTYFLKYCSSKKIQPQKSPKSKKVDRAKLLMTSFYRHRARVSVVK